jgi:PPK2 family polyphosphate:nucleotide phosphotransferase
MKRTLDPIRFQVREGRKVDLKRWPTKIKPFYRSKEEYEKLLTKHTEDLSDLQELLFAHDRYALLLIFQALDAAGKDSAIKHVMSGVNPQGCQVYSFKHPSAEELDHDFLWRTTRFLPERGRIGIFNRSYYEEVLIVRVHPEILRSQALPDEILSDPNIWKRRFQSMVDLENHLYHNGTRILKFFLHISKEEQRKRFLKRIEEPDKNWKFEFGDVEERNFWKQYRQAYEDCLSATSMRRAPWYVVPADDKKNARLIISAAIVAALRELKMSYPRPTSESRRKLAAMRKLLAK